MALSKSEEKWILAIHHWEERLITLIGDPDFELAEEFARREDSVTLETMREDLMENDCVELVFDLIALYGESCTIGDLKQVCPDTTIIVIRRPA